MAYNFFAGKMLSQDADSQVTNAVAEVELMDGSLVALGDLVKDDTYAADGLEYDVYEAAAPKADTDEVVIVDYAGISEGEVAGNVYKLGHKLHNLAVPAGVATRVRRLALHDKFWLGADNFESKPTVGQFAIPTAHSCKHTPVAELESHTGKYAVKILVEKDLTAGMATAGKQYLCEVVAL